MTGDMQRVAKVRGDKESIPAKEVELEHKDGEDGGECGDAKGGAVVDAWQVVEGLTGYL